MSRPVSIDTFADAPLSARELRLAPNEPAPRHAPRMAVSAKRYRILLRELHLARWSRNTLATFAGVSAPTIRLIEIGRSRWVYPETARRLDRLWDCLDCWVPA